MKGVSDTADSITYRCPRCSNQVTERYYGPCTDCRNDLRSRFASTDGDAKVISIADYVPKVNVTPNAVALKDD